MFSITGAVLASFQSTANPWLKAIIGLFEDWAYGCVGAVWNISMHF